MLGIASRIETLPADPLAAIRETLRKMVAIVRKYSGDLTTNQAASAIIRAAGVTDTRTQRYQAIKAIQTFVRDRIGYAHDPDGIEMLQTPPATLARGYGDCDDKAILTDALLKTLGFQTEFLAVGGTGPGWTADCATDSSGIPVPGAAPEYSHVLAAVRYGPITGKKPAGLDGYLPLETIVPGAGPGWFPAGVKALMWARV